MQNKAHAMGILPPDIAGRIDHGPYNGVVQFFIVGVDGTLAQLGNRLPDDQALRCIIENADRAHVRLVRDHERRKLSRTRVDKQIASTHIPARMITNAKFVEIWQTSDSIDDVVKTTGMKKGSILGRANRLKKGGVDLKKAGRTRAPRKGRAPVDYSQLKELAASLVSK